MNRITPVHELLADFLAGLTDEPEWTLAMFRAMFDDDRDAVALLAARLPTMAAELAPFVEGTLRAFVTRVIPRADWLSVAGELAKRWSRIHSRELLQAGCEGMKLQARRPVRRELAGVN